MTLNTIGESQQRAAKVAGFALLFAIAIVVIANFGISFRLIVPGNVAETARNIIANETLFRINIACDLIYVVNAGTILAALYVVLEPVNRNLALMAAFCRLVYAVMWAATALNMLGALRLMAGGAYLSFFEADRLQALASLHLRASYDAYYVGLPFWGLASTVCGYLLFKSRYIPRVLSAIGVMTSAWCVLCAFAFLVFPHFNEIVDASWFDSPMLLFELALGLWLVFKGLRPSPRRERIVGGEGQPRPSPNARPTNQTPATVAITLEPPTSTAGR